MLVPEATRDHIVKDAKTVTMEILFKLAITANLATATEMPIFTRPIGVIIVQVRELLLFLTDK